MTTDSLAGLQVPFKLEKGDVVAVVSPSWGGPATFPYRYETGKRQFEQAFDVRVVPMPHALRSSEWVHANPKARAEDIMQAFSDKNYSAVIASIGGDDFIRLLPYIDLNVIAQNPKIFLGYSDTTVGHFMCLKAGLRSYYGPSIMAGFGENRGIFSYTYNSVLQTIFSNDIIGLIPQVQEWTDAYSNWGDPSAQEIPRPLRKAVGRRCVQGKGIVEGRAIVGCAEVMEILKGTDLWPAPHIWDDAIFFIETSEEKPTIYSFHRWLQNYAAQGILKRLAAVVLARPAGTSTDQELGQYDEVCRSVALENGLNDLPILTQCDFGHTDPRFIIPYGIQTVIDLDKKEISFTEPATQGGKKHAEEKP